ncbi:hypothetical protein AFB00_25620 [Pseudonocardia sp. HH130630-07]|nr:hypothetical protein AFB00_25620 [Pseudonocardia sp. HH130630-07]
MIGHDHVAGLGLLGPVLRARGVGIDWFRVVPAERFGTPDVDVRFPDPARWDLVVTLGAPWPRERIRGWAGAEAAFLRRAHDGGVGVLAICFGAQLLAETLGGGTRPLDEPRIGWFDVAPSPGSGIGAGPWFCWNSEQLVPPPGATVLATGRDGCAAFAVGRSTGLQFHPEMDGALLTRWLGLGAPDGVDPDGLRAATAENEHRAAPAAAALLAALLDDA